MINFYLLMIILKDVDLNNLYLIIFEYVFFNYFDFILIILVI
jgi:hypothetical protein